MGRLINIMLAAKMICRHLWRSDSLALLSKPHFSAVMVLILCVCLLLVSGCGFKLRGAGMNALQLPSVYIHSDHGSRLTMELQRVFQRAGTALPEQESLAEWRLTVSDEQRQRRVLSVGNSGKVQEYELHYRLYYSLYDRQGQVLIERKLLSLLRDFSFSGADVLAKAEEEDMLYQDMQRQAVQMLLRYLLSLDISDAP